MSANSPKRPQMNKSVSMVEFDDLTSRPTSRWDKVRNHIYQQNKNGIKPLAKQGKKPPLLPRSSSMTDFSPEANSQLVNQLYQELRKVSTPSITVETDTSLHVYHRRWYILAIYSLLAGLQAYVWNFWGPIASTSEHAYDWSDSDIAFYANWGPICFIPMVIPLSWLITTKGLRWAMLVAALLVATGSGIRCTYTEPPINKWLVHSGHLLNGLAGPIAKGMGPVVSAVWFPPDQRTTATAIMSGSQWCAIGISFIAGPLVVPETHKKWNVTTDVEQQNTSMINNTKRHDEIVETERNDILMYLYGCFGLCALLLLVILIYFPAKPPRPPSSTASIDRLNYWTGIKHLLRRRPQFWFVAVLYGYSTGIRDAWSSMLNVNLKAHHISQIDGGWIGFYSAVASWIAGIIIAKFADTFKKRFKLFLITLYLLSTLMYIWLTLTLVNILPASRATLYASVIVSSIFIGSTTPLFYESACEIAYPVSEGIANLVLTMQANIASLIFLGVLSIPDIGTVWMNWLLIAAFATTTVALFFMKETHTRSDIDENKTDIKLKHGQQIETHI
ncbi:hypothetical protein SNE40_020256 [Patella caerulea]